MRETPQDLEELQRLLNRSIEQAGPYLRESMEIDNRMLTARQVSRYLQGHRTASLGTVTKRGEPRVAPVAAIFVRGRYYVPTVKSAARSRHLQQRPGVSLTEYADDGFATIIHGQAAIIRIDNSRFDEIDEIFTELATHGGPGDWGGGGPLYIRVDPDVMYATALQPDQYPE